MTRPHGTTMFWVVWGLVIVLAIVHQDVWFWNDRTLVFGFLPVGLAYHALFSLACGVVWALAVRFAWPDHIEEWADEFESGATAAPAAPGPSGAAGDDGEVTP